MDCEDEQLKTPETKLVVGEANKGDLEIKVYKKRWLIVFIFMAYAGMNNLQWPMYSIISNLVVKYYKVDAASVEWTSIVYMAIYPILLVPAIFIIDKKGLRVAGLLGGLGTALGAFIKIAAVGPGVFYVILIGQIIEAASQPFIISLTTRIASVWFKANEVSTACALAVVGIQIGCAIGFVLPPILVKDSDNLDDIGSDLQTMSWIYSGVMLPIALAIIFCFPKKPPHPPNLSQVKEEFMEKDLSTSAFFKSLKVLLQNRGFMIHSIGFGISMGVLSAVGTLLNVFVLHYFEDAQEDAGRMGLLFIITGVFGSIAFGIYLDRTHKYKGCCIFIYALYAIGMGAFMFSLEMRSKLLAYITITVVGFAGNTYTSVAFELAVELTHPSNESTTTGVLFSSSQLFGAILSVLSGYQVRSMGVFWTIAVFTGLLTLGMIITCFVPNELRRQKTLNDDKLAELEEKCIDPKIKLFL